MTRGKTKRMIVSIFACLLLALVVLVACGCSLIGNRTPGIMGADGAGKNAKVNESGLVSFTYVDPPSMLDNGKTYTVKVDEKGNATFIFDTHEHRAYGEMSCAVDSDVVEALEALYREHNVASWNGFDKSNNYVTDGGGFALSMSFADGETFSAKGYNCYPEGYDAYIRGVLDVLRPLADRLCEERRQELIDNGVTGNVTSVYFNVTQHGASGSDSYTILLTGAGARSQNLSIVVESDGTYFPAGRHYYVCSVPDEAIDFAVIQALVEKYKVGTWIDWDETADDYNNAEWFQLGVSFDSGDYISAMGTLHPEGYDGFRDELLRYFASMLADAENRFTVEDLEANR